MFVATQLVFEISQNSSCNQSKLYSERTNQNRELFRKSLPLVAMQTIFSPAAVSAFILVEHPLQPRSSTNNHGSRGPTRSGDDGCCDNCVCLATRVKGALLTAESSLHNVTSFRLFGINLLQF